MNNRFLLVAGLLLGLTVSQARAQAYSGSGQFASERDSLFQRAARARTQIAARIVRFETSFAGVGGTRYKVSSYAAKYVRVKKQIVKHKTSGVEVEKIYYYGAEKRLLLAEYYEQHQLVRLELNDYPMRDGREYGEAFRSALFVRGDYLRLTTSTQEGKKAPSQVYYYANPRQPPQ